MTANRLDKHRTEEHELEERLEEKGSLAAPTQRDSEVAYSATKTWLAVLGLAFTYGMNLAITADMTVYVSASIAENFGPDAVAQVSWISSAWTVPCAITVAIAGRLSDIFGRRNFFLASNVLSLVGSAVSGTASSYSVLIGGAALCGVAGGIANGAIAAASEILPNKDRALGIALLELSIAPLGYLGGSAIAHIIVARSTYKWIYWAGVIQGGVGFALIALFYWPEHHPLPNGRTKWQEFKNVDWMGAFLFSAGIVIFLIGIVWGSGLYAWTDPHTYAPVVVGALTLIALGFWCRFKGEDALIPPRLFRGNFRGFTSTVVVVFVAGMVFFSGAIIWPTQSGLFYATSFEEIGVLGIPQGAGFIIGGVVIGALAPYLGSTRWQLVIANAWQGIFLALMAVLTPESRSLGIALILLANVPYILIVNLTFLHGQFACRDEDIGIACGILNTARFTGGAIAVPIYIATLANKTAANVTPRVTDAVLAAGLPASSLTAFLAAFLGTDGDTSTIAGVNQAILDAATRAQLYGQASAYRVVYLITIPFSVCAVVAALCSKDVRHHFTNRRAVNLQHKEE